MDARVRMLAVAQQWRAGTLVRDEDYEVWRWDGAEFHVLAEGDVCLHRNGGWYLWNGAGTSPGKGWRRLRIAPPALVTMADQVWLVLQLWREHGRTTVLCQPWAGPGAPEEVPIEAVMPVGRPDEVILCGR